MDSKMLWRTLAVVISVVIFMVAAVVFVNYKAGNFDREDGQQTQATTVAVDDNVTITEYGKQIGNDLHGFEEDASFFEEETTQKKPEKTESNYLSMIITSVQRDLRVQIVDYKGNLVTGKSFYVDVKDVGEYKDLDQDGIVYIADLSPGQYEVSLKQVEGYRVSATALTVNVKAQVEYEVISDISLLMRTEDEINVAEDDTEQNLAREDADSSEILEPVAVDNKTRLGIDVSKWNGEIDWKKVKDAGVSFVIIRCGYRGSKTGSLVIDPCFEQNIEQAKEAGLSVGVYFFTQATTQVEAVEEASMVLCLTEQYDLDYPIFIDTEGAGGDGRADALDKETRTAVVKAFTETIRNSGQEAGIYASRSWYNNNLEIGELEQNCIWLAEYRSTPVYAGNYQLWQYTSKGKIDGIEGNVDLDFSYLGY